MGVSASQQRIHLRDFIQISPTYRRSINLEASRLPDLSGYILTKPVEQLLNRFFDSVESQSHSRSWAITGPYGTGKSTFAAFLLGLLAPESDSDYKSASAALANAQLALRDRLWRARESLGISTHGAVLAYATAMREPVERTVIRALARGVKRRWRRGRPPRVVQKIRRVAERDCPVDSQTVIELVGELSRKEPTVLLIDEFGKNLEYVAASGASDPFLLQQLAEHANEPAEGSLFLFTLQHLAFETYLESADPVARHEWRKVQGRFEDVVFSPGAERISDLIQGMLRISSDLKRTPEYKRWLLEVSRAATAAGLEQVTDWVDRAYPLHPVTALVLPGLCERFAQNERTLFSFLASGEPGTVVALVSRWTNSRAVLPSVRLWHLYDYFATVLKPVIATSIEASRWYEVTTRVEDARALPEASLNVLKTIAILNLVSDAGALRASKSIIEFAVSVPRDTDGFIADIDSILDDLQRRGFITYRCYADEYRIWEGTDLNISDLIGSARDMLRQASIAQLLNAKQVLGPLVASRHSQQSGTLRYFERMFVDEKTESIGGGEISKDADGVMLYDLSHGGGPADEALVLSGAAAGMPVLIGGTSRAKEVQSVALEYAAVNHVLENDKRVAQDRVARKELERHFHYLRAALQRTIEEAYCPMRSGAVWRLHGEVSPLPRTPLVRLVSEVCDKIYSRAPRVSNETINRRELTSQGAKARRLLLEAMVSRPRVETLELRGYGPERAMYEALLGEPGIHRFRGSEWGFGAPREEHSLYGVWEAVSKFIDDSMQKSRRLDELYRILMQPPFGMKEGPIPVIVVAALIARQGDVGIYQDGAYCPQLTAEVVERLVKDPRRFAIRAFGVCGARAALVKKLAAALGYGGGKSYGIVDVVRLLVRRLRSLPEFTLRTTSVSELAQRVRASFMAAREPDALLFEELPRACSLEAIPAGELEERNKEEVIRYVECLTAAVSELEGAYGRLLDELEQRIGEGFGISSNVELELRGRALRLKDRIFEPQLKSVLVAASSSASGEKWLEGVAMNLVGKPPRVWNDEDAARAAVVALEVGARFRRVEWLSIERERLETPAHKEELKRLALTSADGTEVGAVVPITAAGREKLSAVTEQVIEKARKIAGRLGPEMLAALVAEHVLKDGEGTRIRAENEKEGTHGVSD